jgi:phage tail sheath protein FI
LGTTPSDAFFVQVGPETMTADDIAQGRLNVVVGFAPHMPAEFVVVRAMQQTATP